MERSKDNTNTALQNTDGKAAPLLPGEMAFGLLLLALGLLAFGMSIELWFRMEAPRISSAAAMPLIASGIWSVAALMILIDNLPNKSLRKDKDSTASVFAFALPANAAIMLAAISAYCLLLLVGISFYIASAAFLYGAMCFLRRGQYLRNLLWSALVMILATAIFRVAFGVIFP